MTTTVTLKERTYHSIYIFNVLSHVHSIFFLESCDPDHHFLFLFSSFFSGSEDLSEPARNGKKNGSTKKAAEGKKDKAAAAATGGAEKEKKGICVLL